MAEAATLCSVPVAGRLGDEAADAVELLEALLSVAEGAAAVARLQVRVEDEELSATHLR